MPITVQCTCGKKLKAKDEAAGKSTRCPACGDSVKFPSPNNNLINTSSLDLRDIDLRDIDPFADASRNAPTSELPEPSPVDDSIRASDIICPFCSNRTSSTPHKCINCGAILGEVTYIYRMQQLAREIIMPIDGPPTGSTAANYLEKVVNDWAKKGWEFFRIDEFFVASNPGCLAVLFGSKAERISYYVATFRKPFKLPTSSDAS